MDCVHVKKENLLFKKNLNEDVENQEEIYFYLSSFLIILNAKPRKTKKKAENEENRRKILLEVFVGFNDYLVFCSFSLLDILFVLLPIKEASN